MLLISVFIKWLNDETINSMFDGLKEAKYFK